MSDIAIRVEHLGKQYRIGGPQYVSVDELVQTVARVAGKEIHIEHVEGPVGVQSRNFSNERMYSIGWEAKVMLEEGIGMTYPWITEQVKGIQRKAKIIE